MTIRYRPGNGRSTRDLMSFGRKLTGHFQGEVVTDQCEVELKTHGRLAGQGRAESWAAVDVTRLAYTRCAELQSRRYLSS